MARRLNEIAVEAIRESIWETPPVSAQPEISLSRWSVKETSSGERHFVGYNLGEHEGRASTAVRCFDPETLTGVTESGRVYHLVGPPGNDPDAEWVWSHWADCQHLQWRDVTSEFVQLFSE